MGEECIEMEGVRETEEGTRSQKLQQRLCRVCGYLSKGYLGILTHKNDGTTMYRGYCGGHCL